MHWINPLSLPSVEGEVLRFLFNVEGQSDGFLFAQGQQVHFSPHLSKPVLKQVRVGDRVRVRALKPRAADVLVALSLMTHSGHTIEDAGTAEYDQPVPLKHKAVQLDGVVTRCLYSHRGDVCGALLENGCILRMHPTGHEELLQFLKPGTEVTVWGDQISVKKQKVIDIGRMAFV
jgi:hypothetical protein